MVKVNKGKEYKLEDVPADVFKVWAVQWYCKQHNTGVGSKLYNECIEIMKKHPDYFPFKEQDKVVLPEVFKNK